MNTDMNKNQRPEAYPRPTETDEQLQRQPEFIDQQPNDFDDKSISDIPASNTPAGTRESDAPDKTAEEVRHQQSE